MVLMNNSLLIVMVVALGVTFVSMVLHELMHGLTAYWLGDDTAKVNGRLSLNPIKHIDPYLTIIPDDYSAGSDYSIQLFPRY